MMRLMMFVGLMLVGAGTIAGEMMITFEDFKGDWPFVANKGTLKCVLGPGGKGKIITFKTSAGEYAVNGTASSHGYMELDPMWMDNEEIPGAKVSVSDVIAYGTTLCEK